MATKALFLGGYFHGHTCDVERPIERLELALPEPARVETKNQSFGAITPKRREVVVYYQVRSQELPENLTVYVADGYEPGEDDVELVMGKCFESVNKCRYDMLDCCPHEIWN